jgi:Zn-finger nucleic acid-binding protein
VLTCFSCGGVWADREATERVATVVDRELIDIARSTAKGCAEGSALVEPKGGRACPICAAPMEAIRHARVTIEVCREHGTWFDRDELGRMARNSEYERKSYEDMRTRGAQLQGPPRPPVGSSADIVEDILGD